jgi:hypothetical protein
MLIVMIKGSELTPQRCWCVERVDPSDTDRIHKLRKQGFVFSNTNHNQAELIAQYKSGEV